MDEPLSARAVVSASGVPAWPVLVAVHATLALAFLGALVLRGGVSLPRRAPPVERQLAALDLPAAQVALDAQLAAAPRAAALPEKLDAEGVFGAVAQRAGLSLQAVEVVETEPSVAVQPVLVLLTVRGHPVDLPVLLGRLTHGPLDAQLHAVTAEMTGSELTARVEVAFSRPPPVPEHHLRDLMRESSAAAAAAEPILVKAAELASWRAYAAALTQAAPERARGREQAAVALTPALVALRASGGRLVWAAGGPARVD